MSVTFPTERKAEWELVSDELYVNVVYDLWEYKSMLYTICGSTSLVCWYQWRT